MPVKQGEETVRRSRQKYPGILKFLEFFNPASDKVLAQRNRNSASEQGLQQQCQKTEASLLHPQLPYHPLTCTRLV